MDINLSIKVFLDDASGRKLDSIITSLGSLNVKGDKQMAALDDLKREVQETQADVARLIAGFNDVKAQLAVVIQQLADAIANNDPAALAQAAADLDAVQKQIDAVLPPPASPAP